MSDQLLAPAALLLGKDLDFPLDKGLGGLQNWSGQHGVKENYVSTRIQTLVPQLSSLWLLYPGSLPYYEILTLMERRKGSSKGLPSCTVQIENMSMLLNDCLPLLGTLKLNVSVNEQ